MVRGTERNETTWPSEKMTEDGFYGTGSGNRGTAGGVLLLSLGTIKIAYTLGKLEIESAIVPTQITRR